MATQVYSWMRPRGRGDLRQSGLYAMKFLSLGSQVGPTWKLGRSNNIARRRGEFGHIMAVEFICPAPAQALPEMERELFSRCPFPLGGGYCREIVHVTEDVLWGWLQQVSF